MPSVVIMAGFWPYSLLCSIATKMSEKKLAAIIMPAEKLKIICIKTLLRFLNKNTTAPPSDVIKKAISEVITVNQNGDKAILHFIKTRAKV